MWVILSREAHPLHLAYFGSVDPALVGFASTLPIAIPVVEQGFDGGASLDPGWYAVSVNFLRGYSHATWDGATAEPGGNVKALAAFRSLEPRDSLGSIYIYELSASDCRTVWAAMKQVAADARNPVRTSSIVAIPVPDQIRRASVTSKSALDSRKTNGPVSIWSFFTRFLKE